MVTSTPSTAQAPPGDMGKDLLQKLNSQVRVRPPNLCPGESEPPDPLLRNPCFWRAVLGLHNLHRHGPHTVKRSIRRILVHSEFDSETFENDLAVFELSRAVQLSLHIQPLCLPPAPLGPRLENGSDCYVSGWGRTSEKVHWAAQMAELLPALRTHALLALCCSLQGDSGGPLMCYHPDRYHLIGIASFGAGCGRPRYPGIYVRLSQYRTWIKAKLLQTSRTPKPTSTTLTLLLTVAHTVLTQTF
ncbi:transmembrane protease serine 12 [Willisornis vidua]|uniref:Transmembrane protease serine 12 n=1 Tax=Willisornis vidua TaxID=1566151 RepID=A0ABQ9DFV5_9PASS|nr:transmembrane protease serine 12 [Willisornis vidua]